MSDYTTDRPDKKQFLLDMYSSELDKNSKKLEKNFGESAYIDRGAIKYYPGAGGYMYASKGEIDKLPSVTIENDLAVDCIDRNDIKYYSWDGTYRLNSMYASKKQIDDLPSVIPIRFVDANKIQAPTTKNDLGVDLISRADVFQILWNYDYTNPSALIVKAIRELPSMTPQEPKTGHWIEHEKSISTAFKHLRECSCCNCYFDWMMPRNSFCPNCGADMREVEE